MAEAVLIMDMPESCMGCNFLYCDAGIQKDNWFSNRKRQTAYELRLERLHRCNKRKNRLNRKDPER